MSVRSKVETFLETLTLDEAGEATAAIALTLASKLDQAGQPDASVGLAAVTGSLAKELRDTLTVLSDQKALLVNPARNLFAA